MRRMEKSRRRWSAWVLIAVFLPMLALSSLHHHPLDCNMQTECYDCVHHIQHAGHISAATHSVDHCVLCHFLMLTYVVGTMVVLSVQRLPVNLSHDCLCPQLGIVARGQLHLRAPPVL